MTIDETFRDDVQTAVPEKGQPFLLTEEMNKLLVMVFDEVTKGRCGKNLITATKNVHLCRR
jgi:hypothetical protein